MANELTLFMIRTVIDAVFEACKERPLDEEAAQLKYECSTSPLDTVEFLLRDDTPTTHAEAIVRARVRKVLRRLPRL